MNVRVEPKPLHEPLGGGSRGAAVVVEPIVAGHVNWSRSMMESPGGPLLKLKLLGALLSSSRAIPVPCPTFLIRHPSAGPIIIDTGLHPSVATDGSENFGGLGARFGRPELKQGEDLPAQLRKRGLDPGAIAVVVMTHLHPDHTPAISEFPDATFVVSELEWRAATSGSIPLLRGYRPAHYDFAFDFRTVDFDRGGIGSYASFGRTFDLFGDGSVRLAFTPGHTAGHMSVIARLRERDFVIGGDATYTAAQLEGDAPLEPRPVDAHNHRRSLQELRLFKRQYPQAIVTPGHDQEFYAGLESRYD